MKISKKYSVVFVLLALIVIRLIIVFIDYQKTGRSILPTSDSHREGQAINPDANLSQMPAEAATTLHQTAKDGLCQSLRAHYQNLEEIKKLEKTSVRFVNVHKKVDGVVYRMRFFYKDSSENDIPTYLLYKEDQNEEEHLIETSPYKKGAQYSKIEKENGTIIYTEEGVNIGKDQDLFLHYENKELKDLQGSNSLQDEKEFIECRF